MFIIERMKTLNLLDKALDASTLRQKVITNNIANVDVPNFKRSEVNFESELRRAIQEDCKNDKLPHGKMTDPRHIPFHVPTDISAVKPRINLDYTTTSRNDGNNVDIEKEIVDASKNTMQYNAYIQRASSAFATLKRVMQTIQ
jgi:flagellar basal-body rod protein FlgB